MVRDFLYALRQLKTNFRFSLIVALTLALGIGTTTAIFSLVSGIVFRQLPFPEPTRLLSLETQVFPPGEAASQTNAAATPSDTSYPDFFYWRSQTHTLEAIASYSYGTARKFTPDGNAQPRIVDAVLVSADFFRVLGVEPMLGRAFDISDEAPGNRSVVISYEFWVFEFASTRDIVGKRITVSDRPATVIGVMPPGFDFPYQIGSPSFWGTLAFLQYNSANLTTLRGDRPARVIARLRPDFTLQQTRAEMNAIQGNLANQYPEDRNESAVAIRPLLDELIAQSTVSAAFQARLLTLFAISALFLAAVGLYATLSQFVARRITFEIGLRMALGAQSRDVFRLIMRRGFVLALIGLAVGFCGFFIAARFFADLLYKVRLFDPLNLAAVCAILLTISMVASAAPAWRATRLQPTDSLREQ